MKFIYAAFQSYIVSVTSLMDLLITVAYRGGIWTERQNALGTVFFVFVHVYEDL